MAASDFPSASCPFNLFCQFQTVFQAEPQALVAVYDDFFHKRIEQLRIKAVEEIRPVLQRVHEIAGAIRYANHYQVADLIITGRGGGSMEDLWAFNDERVARAIYASEIPVISAVGHEPDVTISDYVADLRAATPSNAAELAVPDRQELLKKLSMMQTAMQQSVQKTLKLSRQRLNSLAEKRVLQSPLNYVEDRRVLLDFLSTRLHAAGQKTLHEKKQRFVRLTAALDAMSPLKAQVEQIQEEDKNV